MTRETLELTYQECLTNPNYQFRDLPATELLKLAAKSFQRMPEEKQLLVQQSWATFIGKSANALTPEDLTDILRYRFMTQTNLFFLCKIVKKYSQVALNCHEYITNSFFVQKDPTYPTIVDFCTAYQGLKNRLLLTPRGSFKSSLDIADAVQWIIAFPEVTILILTSILPLATDFIAELKGHFRLDKKNDAFVPRMLRDRVSGKESPSVFQVLFREHCITDDQLQTEFQTSACAPIDKEPTAMAAGIDQNLSGWHVFVMKLDDCISNINTKTVSGMENVNKQIEIDNGMLHEIGFFDLIGTWYDVQDYYGVTIAKEKELAAEEGWQEKITGSVESGRFDSEITYKIHLRAAWWPTEEAKAKGLIEAEMKPEDWVLFFPEKLTHAFLKTKQRQNPHSFAIKYLNNPNKANDVKFPRELLVRRTLNHNQLPQQGMVVTTVDTAYSTKSGSDFTVILTSLIYGGRFYVIDMARGRYSEFELPIMIAQSANRWKPKRICIEDSVGVKWMGRELKKEMDKFKISIPVEYISLGKGSKANSKAMKAKPVLRLLGDERLFFSNACSGLEEIYAELEKFGTGKGHDDIISTLSILVDQFAAYADMEARVQHVEMDFDAVDRSRDLHDLVYRMGKYAVHTDNPTTLFEIGQQPETGGASNDPFADLY